MKRIIAAGFAASLFATSALAQSVPLGPSGSGGGSGGGGSGTVTSVGLSASDGLLSVGGSPVTASGTLTLGIAGASGGIPYFNSASTWATSAALAANSLMKGGGAGAAPTTFTLGGDCTFSAPNVTCTSLNGQAGPASAIVGISDSQTLTNKSIAGSEVNSGTVAMARMPAVFGFPPYISGAVYKNPLATGVDGTSTAGVANSYYCTPLWLPQTTTIKALWIRIVGTSAGNSSAALQGALYNDSIPSTGTSANTHRPGTLVDYTASWATGSVAVVSAAMNNTTDTLAGPAIYWECAQTFDTTITYAAFSTSGTNLVAAFIGSQTGSNVLAGTPITGISTTGTGFGTTNWVAFTASTSWSELTAQIHNPIMAIGVN